MPCVRESIGDEFHFQPKAVKFLMEVATRVTATSQWSENTKESVTPKFILLFVMCDSRTRSNYFDSLNGGRYLGDFLDKMTVFRFQS